MLLNQSQLDDILSLFERKSKPSTIKKEQTTHEEDEEYDDDDDENEEDE